MLINGRSIGPDHPAYIIAELSANHNHDFDEACALVELAKESGADAVKLQTYTPDTMTLDSDREDFVIGPGTIWEGRKLYELYKDAHTPWEWQPKLKELADKLGLDLFSTPFDDSSVDFLEAMGVPAYKIASFENTHVPLLRKVAMTNKPVIVSTGMASLSVIEQAVDTLRSNGSGDVALLKCTSAYPAPADEANLRTIPHLASTFGVPAGLSDHTLGTAVPVAAVALGACIIEKHFTRSRSVPGPDSSFSLEPDEFATMVSAVRTAEQALGRVSYSLTEKQRASTAFRRSLYACKKISAGERFTSDNVRVIRPAFGLPPKDYDRVLGRTATRDIEYATPLDWSMID